MIEPLGVVNVVKSLELKGYGTIMISPINIKEQEFQTVDTAGNPVESKTIGTKAKTVYVTRDGVEVPNSQVCKKFIIEDEEIIVSKFNPTKEVDAEYIEVSDNRDLVLTALDRKFYAVVCDEPKIKQLVLEENKSLCMPLSLGAGFKVWNGILTNWNGKLLLVACRGDLVKELEKYSEDTVELEIEVIPQQKNMKKLVKAMMI